MTDIRNEREEASFKAFRKSNARVEEALKTGDCAGLSNDECVRVYKVQHLRMQGEAQDATNIGLAWKILVSSCPHTRWQIAQGVFVTAGTAGLGYYLFTQGYGTLAAVAPPVAGTALLLLINNASNNPEAASEAALRFLYAPLVVVAGVWHFIRPWQWAMFDKDKKEALRSISDLENDLLKEVRKDVAEAGVAIEYTMDEIFASAKLTPEQKHQSKELLRIIDHEMADKRNALETETLKCIKELKGDINSGEIDPADVITEISTERERQEEATATAVDEAKQDTVALEEPTIELMSDVHADTDFAKMLLNVSEETLKSLGIEETVEELQEIAADANEAVKELGPTVVSKESATLEMNEEVIKAQLLAISQKESIERTKEILEDLDGPVVVSEEPDHRVIDIGLTEDPTPPSAEEVAEQMAAIPDVSEVTVARPGDEEPEPPFRGPVDMSKVRIAHAKTPALSPICEQLQNLGFNEDQRPMIQSPAPEELLDNMLEDLKPAPDSTGLQNHPVVGKNLEGLQSDSLGIVRTSGRSEASRA